jgi:hypothetical protein
MTTAYTNMKMLKEILAVNKCDIVDLLERTRSDKPGRKLQQMGITNIPDDLENSYQSTLYRRRVMHGIYIESNCRVWSVLRRIHDWDK